MGKNTSISLGGHFEDFIAREIASGRYNSVSEIIRTALRLLEQEEQKLLHLRQALDEGEKSGMLENFDADQELKKIHNELL